MPGTLRVKFDLEQIVCHDQHDPVAGLPTGTDLDSEPFLLTYFFAIDGQGVSLNDDFRLEGSVRYYAPPGTHGNLADDSVADGDVVAIPAVIGEWSTDFKRITLPDPCHVLLPDGVPGAIGVVFVLMEQGLESREGMESARQAFVDTLTDLLNNDVIPSISLEHSSGRVTDEQKAAYADRLRQRMTEALLSEQARRPLTNESTSLEKPELLGFDVVTFTHDDWSGAGGTKNIRARWSQALGHSFVPPGNDWEINGRVTAASPCAVLAAALIEARRTRKTDVVSEEHLDALRRFRDDVIARSPHRRGWVALAGSLTPQIVRVLERDSQLALSVQTALVEIADVVKDTDRKRLAPKHFDVADIVLRRIARDGSAGERRKARLLRSVLKAVRAPKVHDVLFKLRSVSGVKPTFKNNCLEEMQHGKYAA